MVEFWFLFICNMLIPVTMLVLGYLFKGIHFPKDVNALCGYRTSMSMKNERPGNSPMPTGEKSAGGLAGV